MGSKSIELYKLYTCMYHRIAHESGVFSRYPHKPLAECVYQENTFNRPFAGSGHMVRNKLHWDANDAVGLPKQRNVGLDCYEFLCFGSPTASFASQCNLFRTM